MGAEKKIEAVREWADDNGWFDMEFIDSLAGFLDENGYLTEGQETALDNIIKRFHIEV